MLTLSLVVNVLIGICAQAAGVLAPSVPAALAAVQFLLGDWVATDTAPGETGGFAFVSGVQGRVIVRTNTAHDAATDQRPEFRHDDLMIIYAEGAALKADYFDNEGHVIRYVGQTRGVRDVAFVSGPNASEPRYRLTYTLSPDNTLHGQFEIAPPGAADFTPYLAWTARKTKR
jgi:hypothetical protein